MLVLSLWCLLLVFSPQNILFNYETLVISSVERTPLLLQNLKESVVCFELDAL